MTALNFTEYGRLVLGGDVVREVPAEVQAYADMFTAANGDDMCRDSTVFYGCTLAGIHPGMHVACGHIEDGHRKVIASWDRAEVGVAA